MRKGECIWRRLIAAIPATGDHFPLILVLVGLVLAAGLCAALLILRVKARKRAEAEPTEEQALHGDATDQQMRENDNNGWEAEQDGDERS